MKKEHSFNFITIERTPSVQVLDLLSRNKIGTPGKSMVYQLHQVVEKVHHIPEPHFASIYHRDRLLGTCCFCRRPFRLKNEDINSFYARYFTFSEAFRLNGRRTTAGRKDQGGIRGEIKELVTGKGLDKNKKNVFYGYIDGENHRSMDQAIELGFARAGSFHVINFSRFFPEKNSRIERLPKEEALTEKIASFFSGYSFFTDENIFYKNQFYGIRKAGRVVIGAQVYRENWKILEMPGASGRLMMSILPKIPVIRRLFHPDFHFLGIEAFFVEREYEYLIEEFLGGLLHLFGVYTAILCLDPTSPMYRELKKVDLGPLSKIKKEKRVEVMARTNGFALGELKSPVYVSSFDVM